MAIAARLCLAVLLALAPASRAFASLEDVGELEAFVDGAARAFPAAEEASGMSVAVVKDGEVLLAKGYGLATREAGTPVDPERTLFRVGSVSMIFLATAIMQLVEQGKLDLDLDTDLNEYLAGVEIPATFPEPITLRHVMTHTTGLEDSIRNLFVLPSAQRSLRETLADHIPERVRPAGELVAYSNHGTALAGLAVEQVSGERYDRPLWRARRWWGTVRSGGTAATAHWLAAILRVGAFVFAAGFGVGATTWALSFGAGRRPR